MSITLYTAPDCLRCKIVKSWLHEKGMSYDTVDFKADSTVFNAFYRTNRPRIYRNPEGVEFPLFDDGQALKQGSGEIIAYLLAGHEMEGCVTRSDLLHGWISGLYPSLCPEGREEDFVALVKHLGQGGLQICLRVDGRKPDLLEKLLQLNLPGKVELSVPVSGQYAGASAPSKEELARSIALVRGAAEHSITLLVDPVQGESAPAWPSRADVVSAAQMLAESAGDKQMPCFLAVVTEKPEGLEEFPAAMLLKFRSASREFLFKIENASAV